jgi:hypothetical protein
VQISAKTYLGEAVPGAAVTLAWTMQSPGDADQTGTETVALETGELRYILSLPKKAIKLARRAQGQQRKTVTIKVSWLDASRDLLQQSVSVPVRQSAWQATLSVDPGASALVPGFPFSAEVKLSIPAGVARDPSKPSPVHIKLVAADGTGLAGSHALVARPSGGTPVVAGDGDGGVVLTTDVRLTLPSMGHFDIVASFVDDCGVEANSTLRVGSTEAEWYAKPLQALPFEAVKADKEEYSAGDDAVLSWHCPFPRARALVIWGSGGPTPRLMKVFELEQVCFLNGQND